MLEGARFQGEKWYPRFAGITEDWNSGELNYEQMR